MSEDRRRDPSTDRDGGLGVPDGGTVSPGGCEDGARAGLSPSVYDGWTDRRLVDGYRRNSVLLREYGADPRTVGALCAIEARLRARGIDPEQIVAHLSD